MGTTGHRELGELLERKAELGVVRDSAEAAAAAEGRSNREIAHELYVSQKTVETHLTAAYRKLEVARREDLPAAFAKE
jgi:DNA-binding NarL/FixJ family response regulator